MKRRIAIDIGNSRQKIGLFSGDDLILIDSKSTDEWDQVYIDRWCDHFRPDVVGLSSTVPLSAAAKKWIKKKKAVIIDHQLAFPFQIHYTTPKTLGQDRLAAVCGAHALFKEQNVLILDAGTCITYDFLSGSGHYLGGNISPGVQMRLAAMHYYTEQLPRVFMTGTDLKWLGQSTEEAIRAGGAAMAIMEAQGFISLLRSRYGDDLEVILTGGDLHYFFKYLEGKKFVEPNLVLLGINEILKHNEI